MEEIERRNEGKLKVEEQFTVWVFLFQSSENHENLTPTKSTIYKMSPVTYQHISVPIYVFLREDPKIRHSFHYISRLSLSWVSRIKASASKLSFRQHQTNSLQVSIEKQVT